MHKRFNTGYNFDTPGKTTSEFLSKISDETRINLSKSPYNIMNSTDKVLFIIYYYIVFNHSRVVSLNPQ